MVLYLIILLILQKVIGYQVDIFAEKSCEKVKDANKDVIFLLNKMSEELLFLRRTESDIEWNLATEPSTETFELNSAISRFQIFWRNEWCSKFQNLIGKFQCSEERMMKLLCRGPIYTTNISRKLSEIHEQLSLAYSSKKVCKIERSKEKCFHGESNLEKLMATSRNETELSWAWESWQNQMSDLKKSFIESVALQNIGARSNGYHDIGESWREELEEPDLKNLVNNLYNEIDPLYKLLHAVVRYKLAEVYPKIVHARRPIPAHLLGNLWSQNWESLIDLLLPKENLPNITATMKIKNYTVQEMVKKAEDYYLSLGFPPMSKTFWEKSIFERRNEIMNCHASAANMYLDDDFRILACLEVNVKDFQIIHHELGHIQYFMAYKNQPTILRNAPNSAFHEAVGDVLLYGVMAPQNLQRIGFVDDSFLTNNLPILLKQTLSKIPQLPHSLVIDKWRWDVFSGKIKPSSYNRSWWKLYKNYMGIEPPIPRSEMYFDPAGVFHITENVPYIRYFLSNILQVQLFESMCEAAVTGKINNSNFNMPLHQCDIYGSRDAGRKLRSLMKLGSSVHWKDILYITTGSSNYRTEPLLRYYEPVRKWLKLQIDHYNIPVGWD